ncbi:MAG: hypothetical protein RLO51_13240 [Thalassobaculum sp.]|uniref:hypothetical protein n=1 Tax=Thalassobaculum sp. TaxID=2022740 RepID=UPI0032EE8495
MVTALSPDCAVDGPDEVMVTDGGRVAVTTLPLLPVFWTIAAEPLALPALVIVRSLPELPLAPPSLTVTPPDPVSRAAVAKLRSVLLVIPAKEPLELPSTLLAAIWM